MLNVRVIIDGEAVERSLKSLAERFPDAVNRGLERMAVGIYGLAGQWLNGPGAKKSNIPGGGYPVPRRTGHLWRSLIMLGPGESKSGDVGTVSAQNNEFIITDTASYAPAIFLGLGSSAKFGPRDALRDALDLFNHGANAEMLIGQEIQKEINKND